MRPTAIDTEFNGVADPVLINFLNRETGGQSFEKHAAIVIGKQ